MKNIGKRLPASLVVVFFLLSVTLYAPQSVAAEPERFIVDPQTILRLIEQAQISAIEKARKSVVFIETRLFREGENNLAQWELSATGSGIIVSTDGYIITNRHVADPKNVLKPSDDPDDFINKNPYRYKITLANGETLLSELISMNDFTDLAVIKIKNPPPGLVPAQFADSLSVVSGQFVYAIGSPFGLENSVSAGIISNPRQEADFISKRHTSVQTDAAINPGNSGGPLIDIEGRVVGINTSIVSRSGGNIGIGFAIPAKVVQEYLASFLSQNATNGWIGILVQRLDDEMRFYTQIPEHVLPEDLSNLFITQVDPTGPAYGILRENDVIVRIGGGIIQDENTFYRYILNSGLRTKIDFEIYRNGQFIHVFVETVKKKPGQER